MTLEEQYDLSKNSELRKLTEAAILITATQISGEDPTNYGGLGSVWSQKRHTRATQVINSAQSQSIIFANSVSAQVGFNSVITVDEDGSLIYEGIGTLDQDLLFTVNSVWDDVAGVSYEDKQP